MGEERNYDRCGHSSGKRTSVEDRVKCFRMFAEGFGLKQISIETGIHVNSIKRYRKEDEWDKRLDKIYDKVLDDVQLDIVKSIEGSLLIVQTFKAKILTRLKTISPSAMPVQMLSNFKDMHDLEQDLIGQLQAARDTGELSLYSDAQLEAIIRGEEVEGEDGGGAGAAPPD